MAGTKKKTIPPGPTSADRDQIRRAFMAMAVCHELKQPLHSLNLNLELLSKRVTKFAAASGQPIEIDSSMLALGRVVDRVNECLNAFAQRAAPDAMIDERVDLRPLLTGAAARAIEASKDKVHVTVDVAENVPLLSGNADQLAFAIDAVLSNAVHANLANHATAIAVTARSDGDEVRIEIADHGVGMTPDIVRRAFEIGFSTWEGDGTGLTIAKFIAYHHSGGFNITSKPGAGTTVSLVLPVGGGGDDEEDDGEDED